MKNGKMKRRQLWEGGVHICLPLLSLVQTDFYPHSFHGNSFHYLRLQFNKSIEFFRYHLLCFLQILILLPISTLKHTGFWMPQSSWFSFYLSGHLLSSFVHLSSAWVFFRDWLGHVFFSLCILFLISSQNMTLETE